MPLNSGGNFGGPRSGWGDAPGGSQRSQWNSGMNRGRYTNSPEAGLHRGEWQWRGHGPSAQQSYGWDYQGGVGRAEITQRSEARMGSPFQARMAQERGGGLPQGRYGIDYERGERTGRGGHPGVDYDWGWQGYGGPSGGGMPRYGSDYGGGGYTASGGGHTFGGGNRSGSGGGYGASGGVFGGSGNRQGGGYNAAGGVFGGSGNRAPAGGYGRDFQAGYGGSAGGYGGGGMQRGGGYGAQGYGGGMRGGYGGDYAQPLSDAEFYRRVERW